MQCQGSSVRRDERGLVPQSQGLTEDLTTVSPQNQNLKQAKTHRQMFPIKTTALEQKLSLTKAGVTGELGAASHGSSTKERLFSPTAALGNQP